MGKPQKYTPAEVAAALRATKGLIATAARQLKTDRKTVKSYIEKYKTVRDALESSSDEGLDASELRLLALIADPSHKDHFSAVRFHLRTKGKHRGYVERQEISGSGGGPVTIEFVEHRKE